MCLLRTPDGYAFLRAPLTLAFAEEDGNQFRLKYQSSVRKDISLPPQPQMCCSLAGNTVWVTATTSAVGWDIERRELYREIQDLPGLLSIAVRNLTKR